MSILVNSSSRILVQGITGKEGSFHTTQMVEYGTPVVGGVTPGGKGKNVAGAPVFDTVSDAVAEVQPNVSIIFVPARFAPDAIYEAADNGIPFIICITEGIPILDMVPIYRHINEKGLATARPKLSWRHHSGRGQGRHHARVHSREGADRTGIAIRHPHL